MRSLLNRLDNLGGIETENRSARWLERVAFVFLILMVLSAPHSIAATQTAWLAGMSAWLVSLIFKPRPKFLRTPLNFALTAFFLWTAVSSVFSYAPDVSIDKLRGALIFLIFYFVVNNLRSRRGAKFLAFALVFSCMWSVLWSPVERIFGRGVQISSVGANSILAKGSDFNHDIYLKTKGRNLRDFDDSSVENIKPMPLVEGDAIVEVEGVKIRTPEQLLAEIERNEQTYLECFRPPNYFTVKVRRADLNENAENALEKLGVGAWKPSRNWRYGGFYGHIITYAEVLQMIASLALGLLIALDRKRSALGALLIFCFTAMIFALATTFTRSAQIALLASAIAMIFVVGNRKMLLISGTIILPLALFGLFLMQQNRNVGFADARDESINYRQTVYREGLNLWTHDARKFVFGVGMDSTKRFGKEWRLFDDGRLMTSHFHSTPLQLLVERGLPALILWFWILWIYGRTLLKEIQSSKFKVQSLTYENSNSFDWQRRGIILGCFGGLIGFFVSSAVNYSLGDGEVAMVFFILMGIGVSLSFKAETRL